MNIGSNWTTQKFYTNDPQLLLKHTRIEPAVIEIDTSKPPERLDSRFDTENCAILQKPLSECNVRVKFPCNHHFQAKAIQKWFQFRPNKADSSSKCPICKVSIVTDRLQYYVTADKVASKFLDLRKACERSKKHVNEQILKEELDSRIAFPIKTYIPSKSIKIQYVIKPEYENIVRNPGFRIAAMVVIFIQHHAFNALVLLRLGMVISASIILFSAHVISNVLATAVLVSTSFMVGPLHLFIKLLMPDQQVDLFVKGYRLVKNIVFIVPGMLFIGIGIRLERVIMRIIQTLYTRHSLRMIWNHSLTEIPNQELLNKEYNTRFVRPDMDLLRTSGLPLFAFAINSALFLPNIDDSPMSVLE